jgi:hypothetical protein
MKEQGKKAVDRRFGRPRTPVTSRSGSVHLGVRAGHPRDQGERRLHQGLRQEVRLELRPARCTWPRRPRSWRSRRPCATATPLGRGAKNLRTTFIPKSILGGNLQFTATGDVKGAKFYIFKLGSGGKKTLVG